METRASLLDKLVRCELPLNETLLMLSACPWNAEESLHVLQARDVIAVLERYLAGELSAKQVHHWAEALEVRSDIGYPRGLAANMQRALGVLAKADAGELLNQELAISLRNELTGDAG